MRMTYVAGFKPNQMVAMESLAMPAARHDVDVMFAVYLQS